MTLCRAVSTASSRFATSSLMIIAATWCSTVCGERKSRSAISALERARRPRRGQLETLIAQALPAVGATGIEPVTSAVSRQIGSP